MIGLGRWRWVSYGRSLSEGIMLVACLCTFSIVVTTKLYLYAVCCSTQFAYSKMWTYKSFVEGSEDLFIHMVEGSLD